MLLENEFSVNDAPEASEFSLIPSCWYQANIEDAELKSTKAGTGKYISLKYRIDGPMHAIRVVFRNLNISNPNHTAEEIGRRDLASIMRAIGLAKVRDTDQLIGGNLEIKLSIRAETDQYEARNEVKSYRAIGGQSSTAFGGQSAPHAAAPEQPAPKAPWLNR